MQTSDQPGRIRPGRKRVPSSGPWSQTLDDAVREWAADYHPDEAQLQWMQDVADSQKLEMVSWAQRSGPDQARYSDGNGLISGDYSATSSALKAASLTGRAMDRNTDPDDVFSSPNADDPEGELVFASSPYLLADRFTREFSFPQGPDGSDHELATLLRIIRDCSFWMGETHFLLRLSREIARHVLFGRLFHHHTCGLPNAPTSTLGRIQSSLRLCGQLRSIGTINGYITLGEKHGPRRTTTAGGPLAKELQALQLMLPWEKLNFALTPHVKKRHQIAEEIVKERRQREDAVAAFFARSDEAAALILRAYSILASQMIPLAQDHDDDGSLIRLDVPFFELVRPIWKLAALKRDQGEDEWGPDYLRSRGICYLGQNWDTSSSCVGFMQEVVGPSGYSSYAPFNEESLTTLGSRFGDSAPVATPAEVGWMSCFTDFFA